jgi:hypothetical protein
LSGAPARLERLALDIWVAAGPVVTSYGFRYPTRMAVVRLADGGLFVWSPVALSPEFAQEIDALGPVRAIVAPNSLHYLFAPAWKDRYPAAKLFAAPGLAAKRPEIPFDADLGDQPDALWFDQIDQSVMRGNLITVEVVFFHRASKTVLVTDLIQHFPPDWFSGWRGLVARLDGMVSAEPQVPQKFRLAFRDRAAARAGWDQVTAWPAERLVMAHGAPVTSGVARLLRRAFAWLR